METPIIKREFNSDHFFCEARFFCMIGQNLLQSLWTVIYKDVLHPVTSSSWNRSIVAPLRTGNTVILSLPPPPIALLNVL